MIDDLNRVHNQYAINAVIDLAPPVDDENAPELAFGYMEDRTIPYREMVYVSASTKPPRIEISFPNPGTPTRYTLVLLDPDGENLHTLDASFAHWIVANLGPDDVPFGGSRYADVLSGLDEVLPYVAPSHTMGVRRLVFVLFAQAKPEQGLGHPQRTGFNLRAFAENNGLVAVRATHFLSIAEDQPITEEIQVAMQESWVSANNEREASPGWWG